MMIPLSLATPSLKPTIPSPRVQFGVNHSRPGEFFEFEDHISRSSRGYHPGKKTTYGLLFAGVITIVGAIVGSIAGVCNTKPNGAATSLRMNNLLQIPELCPKAYGLENGDVIHPILRYKDGHIDEEGKASGKLDVRAKGMAHDGKVYANFWGIDGAKLPLPKFKVDEDGDVKDGITNFPKGKIKTFKKDVPRDQRDALALWG